MEQSTAILAVLTRLERKLDALARPTPNLLSRRAAARMLGVDRGTTLAGLIRCGRLRLVMGRIPASEIERLLEEGVPPARQRERQTADEGGEIRRVPV